MMRKLVKSKMAVSVLLYVTVVAVFLIHSLDISLPIDNLWESRVCACRKCLTDGDPWFQQLIGMSPQPFLSKDHSISEDDFKWWKHLQGEKRNFTFYNSTLDELFQVIPPVPGVVGPSPRRCRTCAVVGNSGNLLGSHYGSLIDSHDIVIRMNRGRTEGYEADVGSKTTHRVIYPESATQLGNTTRLVFFPFKMFDLLWLQKIFTPAFKSRIANKDLTMILNPAFMRYVHDVWLEKKGRYPSTGFMTVALSLQICDEVNVFGFGADRDGNWNHYFEKLKNTRLRTGPHPGQQEYQIIQELHNKQKIQFFVPQ
ncbi:CMP-N-acetylneuraminate-beta-galactosamide-alpha-2,3-sialyltransferase 1 [Salarias fasciatus]|uniref:ST3 beta-galactoside alpha-2,3-sialyltransferase 1 n=1 Tax=Salarias fasciatus TaxID=181472 RepID=A0A672GZS2_SALFA|nr:CMP-N-acetylneuraminate-beta-galactosamide-alpha-2,3-sialyltransferase 1 [Salarias fasciatus]XP_029976608.1 CMP-N-acetylneuraminate-beta-galactosamide-alpha-2,3-sialyltransferase 1 [Salarias fasciatus]